MTTPEATDPRKVAEAALDMFVYVPVGLALEAKELLPKLAERGRNQVVLARLGARFAMQKAEAEAAKLLAKLEESVGDAADTPAATVPVPVVRTPASQTRASTSPATKKAAGAARANRPAKAPGELAIPGYDTLSASQVVPRLDALRPRELEAIKQHEQSRRGRRTILSRIAQLQG